jgi:ribosomal protein S18 acetylase RimI-like enzyme
MKLSPACWPPRLAELTDSEVVQRISADAYVRAYVPVIGIVPKPALEDYSERIKRGQVWLLSHENSAAGVLVLEPGDDWLTVYSIAVGPAFQGRGFGRMLLDWADHRATVVGAKELRLYTNARIR